MNKIILILLLLLVGCTKIEKEYVYIPQYVSVPAKQPRIKWSISFTEKDSIAFDVYYRLVTHSDRFGMDFKSLSNRGKLVRVDSVNTINKKTFCSVALPNDTSGFYGVQIVLIAYQDRGWVSGFDHYRNEFIKYIPKVNILQKGLWVDNQYRFGVNVGVAEMNTKYYNPKGTMVSTFSYGDTVSTQIMKLN